MRRELSRRRLGLLLAAAGTGLAGCGLREPGAGPEPVDAAAADRAARPGLPDGALGANFNGAPDVVTFPELRAIDASWLRGFHVVDAADRADPAQRPEIRLLLDASDRGYGTAMSLKFQNSGRPLPRPGTPELAADLARLDAVLSTVLDRIDLLCIGNEPFLETRKADRGSRLNEYYEALARHVIDRRRRDFGADCRTRLFLGALNHLDRPGGQTAATARWLDFARRTPELEGVDIHPHVADPAGCGTYLDYVLPKLRADQRILVTEFSLVLFWKSKLREPVAAEYARRYGLPGGTRVWQAVQAAIDSPVPQRQWDDLCATSRWYAAHDHFLQAQVERFRATGRLALATYGVAQDTPMVQDFGPDKTPWLFNSIFASKTVQPAPDGLPGRGHGWFEQFRALQREQDRRPVR